MSIKPAPLKTRILAAMPDDDPGITIRDLACIIYGTFGPTASNKAAVGRVVYKLWGDGWILGNERTGRGSERRWRRPQQIELPERAITVAKLEAELLPLVDELLFDAERYKDWDLCVYGATEIRNLLIKWIEPPPGVGDQDNESDEVRS